MSQDVLSGKQKVQFAKSTEAFTAWSEDHSPDEVQQAISEINDAVAKDEEQIDATIRLNRNEYLAKQALVKRGDEVGLQFARRHPELIQSEQNLTLIISRMNQILRSKGVSTELPGEMLPHVTVSNFEESYRQLCEEGRITWSQTLGSPWGYVEFKRKSESTTTSAPELTQEQVEQQLDSGKLSMDQLKDLANAQLAQQNPNAGQERDGDVVLGRVARPEPNTSVEEPQQGWAALAYGKHINLRQ